MADDENIYRVLGTGTTVNFPKREELSNLGKINLQLPTEECNEEIERKRKFIESKRGEFISACYDLEHNLSQFISEFLFEDNIRKKEIFHELLLDTTIVTFGQKKNIARHLMKKFSDETTGGSISEANQVQLFKKVEEIIKVRNALAHGEVIIDYNNDKAVVKYYDSNKNTKVKIELNETVFSEIDTKVVGLSIVFELLKNRYYEKEFFENFIENGLIGKPNLISQIARE